MSNSAPVAQGSIGQVHGNLEKRRCQRFACNLSVSWRLLGAPELRLTPASIKDLSRGGIALQVQSEVRKGAIVFIQFDGVAEQFMGPWLARVQNVRHEAEYWVIGCAFCNEFTDAELQALIRSRGQLEPVRAIVQAPMAEASPKKSVEPLPPNLNSTERRITPRRKGKRVAIIIALANNSGKRYVGKVVDGSAGGLALAMPRPLSMGTVVKVRASNAGLAIPWATVRVRHCRHANHHWIVGCQFVEPIPDSLLETFC